MYSFIVRHMFKRQKDFFKRLEEFEKTQYYSAVELQTYQEEKLQRLVKHSYETVPFYREVFDKTKIHPNDIKTLKDLEKIPILDKETVRSNRKKLLSTNIDEKTFVRRTGGSTGVPLSIVNSYSVVVIENALYYRFLRWLGYTWGDEILQLWGGRVVESHFSRLKKNIINQIYNKKIVNVFSLNEKTLLEIVNKIQYKPPQILRGYSSAIYLLALKALEFSIQLELNAVTTTAEKLFKFQRDKIESAFGKKLFDQYGCGETNAIAFECERHKGMHVALEHVILEIVGENGQENIHGRIVVTNLDNYAMPIIRYENGDLARWSSEKCDCGRNLPLLTEIEGRVYDFIRGPNGKHVHAGFFAGIFNEINIAEQYAIKEFRIVQEKIDQLRIEFVTEDDLNKKAIRIIKQKINQYLGEMDVEIKKVESIPMTKMGKRMFVVSLRAENH